jgi:hypothetical protein
MKNIQMILINLGLLISLSFCKTNNAVDPVSAPKTEQKTCTTATNEEAAARILGEWEEFSQCNKCHTLIFESGGKLKFIDNLGKIEQQYSYKFSTKDSISIKKDSNNFENFKYCFTAKDTLEIKQFLPVIYGITGYQDILLIKK